MNLIGDKRHLSAEETVHIRNLYTSFKSDLKGIAKLGDTIHGEQSLNRFESAYLMPATNQALNELHAAVNTNPINSNWHSLLYAAQIDIQHFLRQLEGQFPDSK
jgi:hypothetical protein